ncbi:glycosyltransferase [Streptomyces sp. NPDC002144]
MYAIGLCVDERYRLPTLTTLTSLADSLDPRTRRDVALRVLTLDLERSHVTTMADLVKRLGFQSFDLRWCAPSKASRLSDAEYISITTYLRFQFTPEFVGRSHLIYVDTDVLITGDLSAPLSQLRAGHVGAVRDEFNPAVGECPALPGLAEKWPHLRGRAYYNAGVLWTSVALLATIRRGVEYVLVKGRQHILHNDQDALNMWLLASGRAQSVGPAYNRFEMQRFLQRGDWVRRVVRRPLSTSADTALLHFVGPEKPWQADCPATEDVRAYRAHLRRTVRYIHRLGDLGIEAPGGAR